MTRRQARDQALAAGGAMIVTFIGLIHIVVGETIFPWAPAFVGGYAIWYAMGGACLAFGLALLAATLGLMRMPVVWPCIAVAMGSLALTALVAAVKGEFHFFAVVLAAASLIIAWRHPKSLTE